MTQHAGLDAERWAGFDPDRQILMIGNEMNRVRRSLEAGDAGARRRAYERVLRLTDLTVACARRATLRREVLRWRDVVAELYVAEAAHPERHRAAFRALLQLHPVAAKQIPHLAGAAGGPSTPTS